jgi:hypothetical protein
MGAPLKDADSKKPSLFLAEANANALDLQRAARKG